MFSSVVNKIFSPPELLKLDMYRTLPSISRLSESIVQKRKIKFIDYNLNLSILDLSDRICLSMHWHPVVDNKELGKRLPFNWPEIYINEYKQDFNPDSFYSNSLALYKYQSRGKEDEENLILLKDELLKRLLQYSLIQGDARYILYKFDYSLFGGLKAPWVSGFAQGQILSGLVYLHMRFGDEYSLQLAHEIYLSFLKFRNDVDADSFWITEIDNLGFFWVTIQVWLLTHDVFYVSNNKQPVFCSD